MFCACGYKLYTRVAVDSVTAYCLNCQQETPKVGCISTRIIKVKEDGPSTINKYTKYDVRLDTTTMPCKNTECTNTAIKFVCTNPVDLKYGFLCPACDTKW